MFALVAIIWAAGTLVLALVGLDASCPVVVSGVIAAAVGGSLLRQNIDRRVAARRSQYRARYGEMPGDVSHAVDLVAMAAPHVVGVAEPVSNLVGAAVGEFVDWTRGQSMPPEQRAEFEAIRRLEKSRPSGCATAYLSGVMLGLSAAVVFGLELVGVHVGLVGRDPPSAYSLEWAPDEKVAPAKPDAGARFSTAELVTRAFAERDAAVYRCVPTMRHPVSVIVVVGRGGAVDSVEVRSRRLRPRTRRCVGDAVRGIVLPDVLRDQSVSYEYAPQEPE